MAITKYPPNTIWLGGQRIVVNDLAVSAAVTPGMLVERFNNAGVIRFRPHATAGGDTPRAVAVEQSMLNKGVSDVYNINDLAEVFIGERGATFWMLVPSGQNITAGQGLESNGDGKLRAIASGTKLFISTENKNNAAGPGDARIRVEVV